MSLIDEVTVFSAQRVILKMVFTHEKHKNDTSTSQKKERIVLKVFLSIFVHSEGDSSIRYDT